MVQDGGRTRVCRCHVRFKYLFGQGNGVKQSHKEAVEWIRMAAEQDFPRAQYILGLMYNEGIGVKRNKKEALNWATKAYDQGYEEAYDLIKGITRK